MKQAIVRYSGESAGKGAREVGSCSCQGWPHSRGFHAEETASGKGLRQEYVWCVSVLGKRQVYVQQIN